MVRIVESSQTVSIGAVVEQRTDFCRPLQSWTLVTNVTCWFVSGPLGIVHMLH